MQLGPRVRLDAHTHCREGAEVALYPSALTAAQVNARWSVGASSSGNACAASPASPAPYPADVLAHHPAEKYISLLAISVSHLETVAALQLELGLGLADERRRPGTKGGLARHAADRAVDAIRERFGWAAVGYGSVALGAYRSVPDEFRELAEHDL